jgi:hypothetical protein
LKVFSDERFSGCVACGSHNISKWNEKNFWYSQKAVRDTFDIAKCADCGTGFLNPPPSPELLADIYSSNGQALPPGEVDYEQILVREKACPIGSLGAARMAKVASDLKRSPSNRAIDVGSGFGFMSRELLASGFDVEAVNPGVDENDVFEKMNGFRPKPVMLDQYVAEVGAEPFGIAVLSQVLEHMVNPREQVRKLASLLDSGGVLVVGVPNFKSLFVSLLGTKDNACLWIPEHVNYFTAEGLAKLFESEGLKPARFEFQTRIPPGAMRKRLPSWAAPELAEQLAKIAQKPLEATLGAVGRGAYVNGYAVKA